MDRRLSMTNGISCLLNTSLVTDGNGTGSREIASGAAGGGVQRNAAPRRRHSAVRHDSRFRGRRLASSRSSAFHSLTTEMTEVRFDAPQNNLSRKLVPHGSRRRRRFDYFGKRDDDPTRPRTNVALGTDVSPHSLPQ